MLQKIINHETSQKLIKQKKTVKADTAASKAS
jgi:hypothetical protein